MGQKIIVQRKYYVFDTSALMILSLPTLMFNDFKKKQRQLRTA